MAEAYKEMPSRPNELEAITIMDIAEYRIA
jgi:hypothetical protein